MSATNEYPREVVDRRGYVHRLDPQPLGRGGQGVVFRTHDPDRAVKLVTDGVGRPLGTQQARQNLYRRLEDVRILPLPDLHLAKPLDVLRGPHVGYVMQLLTGMVPISTLIAPPGCEGLAEFYLEGGGLRRRLELLAQAAVVLTRLHAVPLTYADVSENNVFVSQDLDSSEAWLIDADNLDYVSPQAPALCTRGFGAPELVQGRSGVNPFTDAHAFAVLAFQVLAQRHPFMGDYVEDVKSDLMSVGFDLYDAWLDQ